MCYPEGRKNTLFHWHPRHNLQAKTDTYRSSGTPVTYEVLGCVCVSARVCDMQTCVHACSVGSHGSAHASAFRAIGTWKALVTPETDHSKNRRLLFVSFRHASRSAPPPFFPFSFSFFVSFFPPHHLVCQVSLVWTEKGEMERNPHKTSNPLLKDCTDAILCWFLSCCVPVCVSWTERGRGCCGWMW